jgi:FixJ family two-component response regulator
MNKEKQNIYIVDDDEFYRKSLVRLLKSVEYSAKSFPSSESFLNSVPAANWTGVLILDLRMPGMDGFDLQKRLNELASKLGIIFITADARPGDRENALRSGAMAFLQKPFDAQDIIELVKSALKIITHKDRDSTM